MIPTFKYHPDPIKTGAFLQGKAHTCDCCGQQTDVWYEQPFFAQQDVECLCPECIASGKAAEKFDGEFVDGCNVGEVSGEEKLECSLVNADGSNWAKLYCLADDFFVLVDNSAFDAFKAGESSVRIERIPKNSLEHVAGGNARF